MESSLGNPTTTESPPAAGSTTHPSTCKGLIQVYPDPLDPQADKKRSKAPKVDIIALHGLNAQSPKTWLAWKKDGDPESGIVHWLADKHMLPHFMPNSRIFTYDWNASPYAFSSSSSFLGQAETLLDAIYRNREDTRRLKTPIIFIASCFGGLLLAKALFRAAGTTYARHDKYGPILNFTIGAIFLATPFRGSWDEGYSAADVRLAIAASKGLEYSRELPEYLRPGTRENPSPLDELVRQFSEMISDEKFKFMVKCAYETRDTNLSAFLKDLPESYQRKIGVKGHAIVVTEQSACLDGADRFALSVRHNMLHKYNSPDDQNFQTLVSRIKEIAEKADDTLRRKGKT